MIKRATHFLLPLLLTLLAAACLPEDVTEQAAAVGTPVGTAEQAEGVAPAAESAWQGGDGKVEETPPPAAATAAPAESTARPSATSPALELSEPPTATAVPVTSLDLAGGGAGGQIYAAAIRQVYTVDHAFNEPPAFPLVYIVTTTDDGTLLEAPATPPQSLPLEMRQTIEAELADLPFEIIWVGSKDEIPVGPQGQIAQGQGIYILLGNILPQDDGSVQLPFYMVCGSLCLMGKTYVLSEIGDSWQVTGAAGMAVQG
jgi:hypothetical protein